ncbi:hypothetical protein HLH89_26180 [Rhizobium laguerreae]|uniref:hypothetical protein n=1 Tax=Rhizobium laguerreae TaxID=1076926 RepID=UPI00147927E5|nr:hypothetical protein [Rhizobium laguerreae]NNH84494.1 hypothetical protein [Rhizobium laguerreae]
MYILRCSVDLHFAAALFFAAAIPVAFFPKASLADAATHQLSIKTKDYIKADCGNGTCTSECSLEAKLRPLKYGPKQTTPIEVQIWYKTDRVENGEAAISLQFEKIAKGQVSTARGQAPGYACKQIEVKRVVVECFENEGQKCPGFYYLQVPSVPSLNLKSQKVEGK